jgi:isoaspartyl peptidase/L-asparaginase-like protein (Ntn-hydrolase superfamily)
MDGGVSADGRLFAAERGAEERWRHHDTIGAIAIDAAGGLAGACSTSGTPFKRPGRVGDSPIVGHGLYVDPVAGAATATGAGELVMGVCGSFLAVECLRRGASPLDAALEVLQRIVATRTPEPHQQVALIVVRPDGRWASAALRPGFLTAVRDGQGARLEPPSNVLIPDDVAIASNPADAAPTKMPPS